MRVQTISHYINQSFLMFVDSTCWILGSMQRFSMVVPQEHYVRQWQHLVGSSAALELMPFTIARHCTCLAENSEHIEDFDRFRNLCGLSGQRLRILVPFFSSLLLEPALATPMPQHCRNQSCIQQL